MSNAEFVQPLSDTVMNMTEDKLTDFQKLVSGIPDLIRLTFGEPGFNVDQRIKDRMIQSINENN